MAVVDRRVAPRPPCRRRRSGRCRPRSAWCGCAVVGAVLGDPGREATRARQRPERRQGIAEPAPAPLELRARAARASSALRPIEATLKNGLPLTRAEVDPPAVAGEDDVGGGVEVVGDAEGAGEVVGGAHRQDAEGHAGGEEPGRGAAEAAVAAADDGAVGDRRRSAATAPRPPPGSPRAASSTRQAAGAEPVDDAVDRLAAAARLGIDQQDGAPPARRTADAPGMPAPRRCPCPASAAPARVRQVLALLFEDLGDLAADQLAQVAVDPVAELALQLLAHDGVDHLAERLPRRGSAPAPPGPPSMPVGEQRARAGRALGSARMSGVSISTVSPCAGAGGPRLGLGGDQRPDRGQDLGQRLGLEPADGAFGASALPAAMLSAAPSGRGCGRRRRCRSRRAGPPARA